MISKKKVQFISLVFFLFIYYILVKNARLSNSKEKINKYKTPKFQIIFRLKNKSKKVIDERKTNSIFLKDSLMFYENELIKL